jgi:hypothetical protein
MAEVQNRDTTNRWWEYYFLRYFVGSMAVVFLNKFPSSHFSGFALTAIKDSSDLGIKEVGTHTMFALPRPIGRSRSLLPELPPTNALNASTSKLPFDELKR